MQKWRFCAIDQSIELSAARGLRRFGACLPLMASLPSRSAEAGAPRSSLARQPRVQLPWEEAERHPAIFTLEYGEGQWDASSSSVVASGDADLTRRSFLSPPGGVTPLSPRRAASSRRPSGPASDGLSKAPATAPFGRAAAPHAPSDKENAAPAVPPARATGPRRDSGLKRGRAEGSAQVWLPTTAPCCMTRVLLLQDLTAADLTAGGCAC